MTLGFDDVRDILAAIDASTLEELDLEFGDLRLVVRKRAAVAPATAGTRAAEGAAAIEGEFELKAPSVGIFRRASGIEVGGVAGVDAPLGFVEALGERGAVHARESVRVVRVLVEDGEFVEYGQPLMVLACVRPESA